MKLRDLVSRLKRAKFKVVDFHVHDMDRAGDLFLALALALTAACIAIAQLHAPAAGFAPAFPGRLAYM